jgi:hypothetical protein
MYRGTGYRVAGGRNWQRKCRSQENTNINYLHFYQSLVGNEKEEFKKALSSRTLFPLSALPRNHSGSNAAVTEGVLWQKSPS